MASEPGGPEQPTPQRRAESGWQAHKDRIAARNDAARKAFRAGEWNRFHIECRVDSIKTWLNDVPAADLKDSRVSSGFIALQVHGVRQNEKPLQVRFRNLRLKEQ